MSNFNIKMPRSRKKGGQGCLVLFGLPFFGAGCFMLWMLVISPMLKLNKSMDWVETSCRIVKSELKTSRSSDGNTYRPLIKYSYAFQGQAYENETVDFGGTTSSSDRSGESEYLKDYPKGSKRKCFVNPDNPQEAVLVRDWGRGIFKWIAIPFGGVFALVGLGIMIYGASPWLFKRKKKDLKGEVVLKPSAQRLGNLAGVLFINIFWNGIVSVFLIFWLNGLIRGTANGFFETWGMGLFLTPFIAVGGGMVWALFKSLRDFRAPQIFITLQDGLEWKCGQVVKIQWDIPFNVDVESVRLDFVCRESATYRRGTNTTTDDKIVATIPIAEEKSFGTNKCDFPVPDGLMPTFESQNNLIEWAIRLRSEGPGPDADDLYIVKLLGAE